MITNYILLIILFFMAISLYKHFSILFDKVENFDSKKNCMKLGYTLDFCSKIPLETSGPCYCPAGREAYVRYNRCYCPTYI